jgi:hypothetical protein
VEWRPPQTKERNGIIRGYYVHYFQVDDNDEPKGAERMQDTGDGNRNEAVITGLDPDTRYHIQVVGYTRKGDGIRSRAKTVITTGAGRGLGVKRVFVRIWNVLVIFSAQFPWSINLSFQVEYTTLRYQIIEPII